MNLKSIPSLCALALISSFAAQANAQTSPAVGDYGSIWIHSYNSLGRLDFSNPTTATYTHLSWPSISSPEGDLFPVIFTDIAWAPDYSTMYGIFNGTLTVDNGDETVTESAIQALASLNPNTGAGTVVGYETDSDYVFNAAGYAGGSLYTANARGNSLFRYNTLNGSYEIVGEIGNGSDPFRSVGDIATHGGVTYAIGWVGPDGGFPANNYLWSINLNDPSQSINLGLIGTGGSNFSNGYSLASIEGVGLYAINSGNKSVYLLDPTNPASLQAVTMTNEIGLEKIDGATGAPGVIPEPSTYLLLGAAGGLAILMRQRRKG